MFLDSEQEVVVPLVQPHGGLIGLNLVGKSLAILILDMLAQSLDIQTKARSSKKKRVEKVEEEISKKLLLIKRRNLSIIKGS